MDPTIRRLVFIIIKSQPSISARHHPTRRRLYNTSTAHLPKPENPNKPNCTTTNEKKREKWYTLPPYEATIDGAVLGKSIFTKTSTSAKQTTALKWVLRSCPRLPRTLVQKLFRLRQVRRESSNLADQASELRLKRVAAKDSMNNGDRIFLPISVHESPPLERHCSYNEEEFNFIRGLVFYKDQAIIAVNKPPGLPVQGGIGIKRSLDEIAAASLRYDYTESPRLVHRLDRDSSGILVMGRTQASATVLHSLFREKTSAAADDDFSPKRMLQKKYWALVMGSPRRPNGLISVPLGKVVVDDGKSDRITVVDDAHDINSQHAVTKYKVINSSHGYTWLELTPLTGRKHQLRVHCADVLGTPIVGDYKYGWQARRKWKNVPDSQIAYHAYEDLYMGTKLPLGLDLESGSVFEKHPRLHLHCKQMVLPHVSQALQGLKMDSEYDCSLLETIDLDAPLPSYMQRSWDLLNS